MRKKKEDPFFLSLNQCCDLAEKAAECVVAAFESHPTRTKDAALRPLLRSSEQNLAQLRLALTQAFLPPLDRDDLLRLGKQIDRLTHSTEYVLLCLYSSDKPFAEKDFSLLASQLVCLCHSLGTLVKSLSDRSRAKTSAERLALLEKQFEEWNRLFWNAHKKTHLSSRNPMDALIRQELLGYLQVCKDACQNAADVFEEVIMKQL